MQNEEKVWLSDWIVNTPRYDYKSTCNAKKKLDRKRYFVERGAFAKQVEKLRTIIHFRMGPLLNRVLSMESLKDNRVKIILSLWFWISKNNAWNILSIDISQLKTGGKVGDPHSPG